jgi:hypothetical protein
VPWFVAVIDGKPDFRVTRNGAREEAYRFAKCWICGDKLGAHLAWVVGPMCLVNHTSSEPPSHQDCAEYSAIACPFLVNPQQQRRPYALPSGVQSPGGVALDRNPGVALVATTTRDCKAFGDGSGGWLIRFGVVTQAKWFAHGRVATRDEIIASFTSGIEILRDLARTDGPEAEEELQRQYERALEMVPA